MNRASTLSGKPGRPSWPVWLNARQGALIPFGILVGIILLLQAVNPSRLGYFDVSTISASATTLALAAIGETIVVIGGGLDLSVGSVVSLVNVVLVTQLGAAGLHPVVYDLLVFGLSLGLGAGVGAINGFLVGYMRLQSIIV